MTYALRPTDSFLKELAALDKSVREIVAKKLDRINEMPTLSKPLGKEPNCFSERVKGYRIVFEINGEEIILYRVRKRKFAYD